MNDLKIFSNEKFGTVRTVIKDNEPWFVAADVCRALEIAEPHRAISRLDEDEKGSHSVTTPGGTQDMSVVNEPGLYSLVLGSRKPEAKEFKRWITHEVIPSIRKTGMYMTGDVMKAILADPRKIGEMLIAMADKDDKIAKLETEKQVLLPKADYTDIVLNTHDAIPIKLIAKDFGWTAQKLNNFLRDLKIQHKDGKTWTLNDAYADKGYTESETVVFGKEGDEHSTLHTKWTQKGRHFIYELMKEHGYSIKPGCELSYTAPEIKEDV